MTICRWANTMALLAVTISASHAGEQELRDQGFQVLWQGFATVQQCVHGKDQYRLGAFTFACDQHTAEYPYHYGQTTLMGLPGQRIAFICLEDVGTCLPGSIAKQ